MMGDSEEGRAMQLECQKQMEEGEECPGAVDAHLGCLSLAVLLPARLQAAQEALQANPCPASASAMPCSLWQVAAAHDDPRWLPLWPRGGVV